MGLDMYLIGKKFDHTDKRVIEDGYEVTHKTLDLGYWRKHPNLHGYIVENFGNCEDNCQEIELPREAIVMILEAIGSNDLPDTDGFFFGETDGTEKEDDTAIFTAALAWLDTKEAGVYRSISYQASW